MSHHDFGGEWTQEKLKRVDKYLRAYTRIFARNPKARKLFPIYIDAFAGTGYRTLSHPEGNLEIRLPELIEEDNTAFLKGSARIALEVDPPFAKYIFVERDAQRAHELEALKIEFPLHAKNIHIEHADANFYLINWCARMRNDERAVVFLDPYGMQVEWSLIETIARTQKIDLWILFPLGVAVNRLLTKDGPPPDTWAQALTRIFGTEDWSRAFYPTKKVLTLFGEEDQQTKQANYEEIGKFFVERLKTVFTAVAENPLPLLNSRNNPLYILCFASGNPVGAKTAVKIAQNILGKT